MTFLIDSDKINDFQFLDAFCSNNILSTLQKLNNLGIYLINYSLIQALSFLLVNLTNNTTTYYIYSNNILNEMITITIQKYDDEYLSYYINFLKSIALRIETDTIQFFYNENTNSFPIVENALKLYNYSNPMISTVVHNIMLGILNVRYEPVKLYFSKLPTVEYFIFIACRLRDLSLKYVNNVDSNEIYEDIIDEIMYVNYILCIGIDTINFILTNALFYYFIMPVVIKGIIQQNKEDKRGEMIILLALFSKIKEESFVNVLFKICFSDYISNELLQFCDMNNKIQPNKHYYHTWKEQQQKPKETYIEFIMSHFSDIFFKALPYSDCWVYSKENEYKEISQLKQKASAIVQQSRGETRVDYRVFEKMIVENFQPEDVKNLNSYHQSVCFAIGIKVGIYFNPDFGFDSEENKIKFCFLNQARDLLLNVNNTAQKENPIQSTIMNMFKNNSPTNNVYQIIMNFMLWIFSTQAPISDILYALNGIFVNIKGKNVVPINIRNNDLSASSGFGYEINNKIIQNHYCFDNEYLTSIKQSISSGSSYEKQFLKNKNIITTLIELLITDTIDICNSKCYDVIEFTCIDLIYLCNHDDENFSLVKMLYSKVKESLDKEIKAKSEIINKDKFIKLNKKVNDRMAKILNSKTCYELIIKRLYKLLNCESEYTSKMQKNKNLNIEMRIEKMLLICYSSIYLIKDELNVSNETFYESVLNLY